MRRRGHDLDLLAWKPLISGPSYPNDPSALCCPVRLSSPSSCCRVVYVLPAFQVPSSFRREQAMKMADQSVGLTKEQLLTWYERQEVVPFDPGKPGHAATNYTR